MGFFEFLFSRPLSKESFGTILELSGDYLLIEPKDNPPYDLQDSSLSLQRSEVEASDNEDRLDLRGSPKAL